MPPRLTLTNGLPCRLLFSWIASAISSLPVPLSPVISTGAFVWLMREIVFKTCCRRGDLPMILSKRSVLSVFPFFGSGFFSSLSLSCMAVSIVFSKARLFQGFVIKSKAPARMPWTARLMEPQAVIRITGTAGQNTRTLASSSSPSSPVVVLL